MQWHPPFKLAPQFCSRPDPDTVPHASDKRSAIKAERYAIYNVLMPKWGSAHCSRPAVPQLCCLIITPGEECLAVGT